MKNQETCIIVDSCSTINNNQIDDVYMVPLSIIEKTANSEIIHKDLVDISVKEVIEKVAQDVDLTTSQTSLGDMLEILDKLTPKYHRIFVVPISRGLSGSFNTWNIAKQEFPKNEIVVLDACDVGTGHRDVVLDVKELVDKGATTEEIVNYVEDHKKRRLGVLIVTDLKQLIKGGRVGKVKGFIASALKLNIMIKFDGALAPCGKHRDVDKAIDETLEIIDKANNFKTKGLKRAYFYTTFLDENANKELKAKVDQKLGVTTEQYYIPGVISVHTGAKTFAVYLEAK